MSFPSSVPSDLMFKLAYPKYNGDNSKYICIKIIHQHGNAVTVSHSNGTAAKTIPSNSTE